MVAGRKYGNKKLLSTLSQYLPPSLIVCCNFGSWVLVCLSLSLCLDLKSLKCCCCFVVSNNNSQLSLMQTPFNPASLCIQQNTNVRGLLNNAPFHPISYLGPKGVHSLPFGMAAKRSVHYFCGFFFIGGRGYPNFFTYFFWLGQNNVTYKISWCYDNSFCENLGEGSCSCCSCYCSWCHAKVKSTPNPRLGWAFDNDCILWH